MSKIMLKMGYSSSTSTNSGGSSSGGSSNGTYSNYIATREGVDKNNVNIDENKVSEDNSIYVKYIDERLNAHGLFDENGVADLKKSNDFFKNYEGTVYRPIISFKREESEEIGIVNKNDYYDMVKENIDTLITGMGLNPKTTKWVGAFHDESYHPHVHLMIYDECSYRSKNQIDKDKLNNIRQELVKNIFSEEYKHKTLRKNLNRDITLDHVNETMKGYALGEIDVRELGRLDENMTHLSNLINNNGRKGKLVYSYMDEKTKNHLDKMVDQLFDIDCLHNVESEYLETIKDLCSLYNDIDDEKNIVVKESVNNAQKDLRKRMANIILNAEKEIYNFKKFGTVVDYKKLETCVDRLNSVKYSKIDIDFKNDFSLLTRRYYDVLHHIGVESNGENIITNLNNKFGTNYNSANLNLSILEKNIIKNVKKEEIVTILKTLNYDDLQIAEVLKKNQLNNIIKEKETLECGVLLGCFYKDKGKYKIKDDKKSKVLNSVNLKNEDLMLLESFVNDPVEKNSKTLDLFKLNKIFGEKIKKPFSIKDEFISFDHFNILNKLEDNEVEISKILIHGDIKNKALKDRLYILEKLNLIGNIDGILKLTTKGLEKQIEYKNDVKNVFNKNEIKHIYYSLKDKNTFSYKDVIGSINDDKLKDQLIKKIETLTNNNELEKVDDLVTINKNVLEMMKNSVIENREKTFDRMEYLIELGLVEKKYENFDYKYNLTDKYFEMMEHKTGKLVKGKTSSDDINENEIIADIMKLMDRSNGNINIENEILKNDIYYKNIFKLDENESDYYNNKLEKNNFMENYIILHLTNKTNDLEILEKLKNINKNNAPKYTDKEIEALFEKTKHSFKEKTEFGNVPIISKKNLKDIFEKHGLDFKDGDMFFKYKNSRKESIANMLFSIENDMSNFLKNEEIESAKELQRQHKMSMNLNGNMKNKKLGKASGLGSIESMK